jgi:putative tryptophan/tyrosine transport system substrate-binding protein
VRRREFFAGLGGAVAWPLTARAQQRAPTPLIGYIDSGPPQPKGPDASAFRAGLADAGFVEGQNLAIEYRWGNDDFRRIPRLAADLVRSRVAVIVTVGAHASTFAAKGATSTIPIVFVFGGDPVQYGLVDSLNRPDGNTTGVTLSDNELVGKRLELLHYMVSGVTTVAFLSGTPNYTTYREQTGAILAAGRELGLEILIMECRDDRDFESAFDTMLQRQARALTIGNFPFSNLDKIVALAGRHKIPAMYPSRALVAAGGLMSYTADRLATFRQAGAQYVARILKGSKPADLPVQRPTKFWFVINRQTARVLGI